MRIATGINRDDPQLCNKNGQFMAIALYLRMADLNVLQRAKYGKWYTVLNMAD